LLELWEVIGRSNLLVKGKTQADRMLQLITYSFKNNEFQESILLAEKLLENLTVLYRLIDKIHVVNNTIVGSYDKATTRALRELLDNAAKSLREADMQARNFNFDAAEELIKSSEQDLNQFYILLDRTVKAENELDQLTQLLVAVNKTVVNMEARQRLERANNLIREAGESINLGRIEEAKSLLTEVKLLIEEAKSLEEKSQLSLVKLNLTIAIIIGIAIITILLMVLKTRRGAEKRNI
jgi:cellobiose-specific phosphotransferase system component IIA